MPCGLAGQADLCVGQGLDQKHQHFDRLDTSVDPVCFCQSLELGISSRLGSKLKFNPTSFLHKSLGSYLLSNHYFIMGNVSPCVARRTLWRDESIVLES
jgi:hypothetical protein